MWDDVYHLRWQDAVILIVEMSSFDVGNWVWKGVKLEQSKVCSGHG